MIARDAFLANQSRADGRRVSLAVGTSAMCGTSPAGACSGLTYIPRHVCGTLDRLARREDAGCPPRPPASTSRRPTPSSSSICGVSGSEVDRDAFAIKVQPTQRRGSHCGPSARQVCKPSITGSTPVDASKNSPACGRLLGAASPFRSAQADVGADGRVRASRAGVLVPPARV